MRQIPRPIKNSSAIALVALMTCAACGESGDPDKDDRRGRAKEITLGQVVTDSITPPIDEVDWKLINVPGSGFLTVNVFWDNFDVDSVVTLVDEFGRPLEEEVRDKRSPSDEIIITVRKEGFYFVKVFSSRGESVYSLQTSFKEDESLIDPDGEPIPEFVRPIEPGSEGEKVESGGGGGGGGGGGSPGLPPLSGGGGGGGGGGDRGVPVANAGGGPTNDRRPAATRRDLVPDINVPFDPVDGPILRVIPIGTGGCEITIGVGTNNGVRTNQVGEVMMKNGRRLEGGRLVITESYKRSSLAKTNAPANMVNAADKVSVKVPR